MGGGGGYDYLLLIRETEFYLAYICYKVLKLNSIYI